MGGKRVTTKIFKERAKLVHGEKFDYTQTIYEHPETKVKIICQTHGIFESLPYNHLNGSGCPRCRDDKLRNDRAFTNDQFIEKAKKVHGDFYDYSAVQYVNSNTLVTMLCPDHGAFSQLPNNHLNGHGCQKCATDEQRITKHEFVKRSIDSHGYRYDYSTIEFVDMSTKIAIFCKIHQKTFLQNPRNHVQGQGCPECGNDSKRLTLDEFLKRATDTHGDDVYDYSNVQYCNMYTKIKIMCPSHGKFIQKPQDHLNGRGCPICAIEKQRMTVEEFVDRANEIHDNLYEYSQVEYLNYTTKVVIICSKHGEYLQLPGNHLKGHGCSKCRDERLSEQHTRTKEEFIKLATEIHGSKYDYTDVIYVNCKERVKIRCQKHGHFYQTPDAHINGRSGCPTCNYVKAEEDIARLCNNDERVVENGRKSLKCIDIHNNCITRILYPDRVGKTVSGKKFIIECDGRQHFEEVYCYGNQVSDLRDQVCRDLAKNIYARDNNWSMLRISYLEYDDIAYWFDKFISAVESSDTQVFMCSNPTLYNKLRRDTVELLNV